MYIKCPFCDTQYTLERLGLTKQIGRSSTVSCKICDQTFDFTIKKRILRKPVVKTTRR